MGNLYVYIIVYIIEMNPVKHKTQNCFIGYTVTKTNKPIPKIMLVSLSSRCPYLLTIFRQTVVCKDFCLVNTRRTHFDRKN